MSSQGLPQKPRSSRPVRQAAANSALRYSETKETNGFGNFGVYKEDQVRLRINYLAGHLPAASCWRSVSTSLSLTSDFTWLLPVSAICQRLGNGSTSRPHQAEGVASQDVRQENAGLFSLNTCRARCSFGDSKFYMQPFSILPRVFHRRA